MIYTLSQLVEWTRRTGSDKLKRNRDVLVADGTDELVLSNDGNIQMVSLKLGGVLQTESTDYNLDSNVVQFVVTPPVGTQVIASYDRSVYTDAEIVQYILDALREVMSELALFLWQINAADPTNPLVNDPWDQDITATDTMQQALETLIALKAGLAVRKDIANSAGGDAILIKDGDTTIDTSKTAAASEKVLKRMENDYQHLLKITIANRTRGTAIQNNWVPLPYPWSTPNMMPGEVNGPTY